MRFEQITEHAFENPESGIDECQYELCGFPEAAHLWTVGAYKANPPVATA